MVKELIYSIDSHQSLCLRLIIGVIAMVITVSLLTGCDFEPKRKKVDLNKTISEEELRKIRPKNESDILLFSFALRATPEEDAKQYLPFLKYLEKASGYRFKLCFTPKGKSIAQMLGSGKIHFAAIGAGSYLKARAEYNAIPIVRGLNIHGKAEYQAMIIVPPDSTIQKIKDLQGKRFAFGDIASTQGWVSP